MKIFICLYLVIFYIFSNNLVHAQITATGRPTSGTQINIGHFYGKIIDAESLKPIDGATLQLVQNKPDSLVKKRKAIILATLLSTKNGDFSIENLPVMGAYKLRISAVGYKAFEQKVSFELNGSGLDKDLGNIKLIQDAQQLQNVTVNAGKSLLQLSLDKKIYNVEKDISTTGGTAIDVMKNVPSVNVDIDGNVTLRNAAPQIFIDGRPTALTLDQIPADQISSVEIITNPSAKYDASGGGAGILNIVLKKNRKVGYNGNLRASVDSRGKPGFGGDINIKQNKINFFAASQVGFRRSITQVNTSRIDFLGKDSAAHFTQSNKPFINGLFAFGRLGFDYFIDNRNTITISGNAVNGHFKVHDLISIYSDTIAPTKNYMETALRTLKADIHFRNYGSSLGFKHNFARAGKEWTADANYIYSINTNTSDYKSSLFDQNNNPKTSPGAQRATGGGNTKTYTFQTDYADPFTKTKKIEFGLRSAVRNYYNWNDNFIQDQATGNYIIIPQIGVRYDYKDEVYAAYATYSQQLKKLSYQAGVRVESSRYNGDFLTKNQQFSNKYPFSFFPGIYLSYKLNDKEDVQVNYSRKINRPNFFQLIPFVDFSDSLNLTVGNPDLKPEFTNLAEIAYSNQYSQGNTILISLYGKITNDLITRYQFDSLINPDKLARYITYANANKSYTAGLELTGKNKIAKWWDVTSNLNLYDVEIKAANLPGVTNSSLFSWFAKLNNSFKLPQNYSIQFSGDYQAKTLLPAASGNSRGGGGGIFGGSLQSTSQGYILPIYGADIALKKDFLKNNAASFTLQWSDIFRTRVAATHAQTAYFVQDNRRLRDPQVVRLNFNWRFGKFDAALFKRKNLKGEQESIQNVQGGQ
ncbi:MAG: outer membrane beta-barrel family protein [Ferruginibacter sp.]